jgi:16S rRNA (cytosine1402-N4)-methyltransferase
VLLAEAAQALVTQPGGIYVDGTFGRGGHSRAVLALLDERARLVAFDKDPQAVSAAQSLQDPRFVICHASFSDMASELHARGVGQVQGVLLDLGVSSPQIDQAERGFSFRHDAALDMRMDTTRGITAAQFLAQADQRDLERVIRDLGEERFAAPIARALVARRDGGRAVATTLELATLVAGVVKTREPGQNPATRTFQALRLHINGELEALQAGLEAALLLMAPEARLVVISFHSLEDRIVKTFIARESRETYDRRVPMAPSKPLRLHAVARIKPSQAEVSANPRSRSAVMRVAQRTEVAA